RRSAARVNVFESWSVYCGPGLDCCLIGESSWDSPTVRHIERAQRLTTGQGSSKHCLGSLAVCRRRKRCPDANEVHFSIRCTLFPHVNPPLRRPPCQASSAAKASTTTKKSEPANVYRTSSFVRYAVQACGCPDPLAGTVICTRSVAAAVAARRVAVR